MYLIHIQTYMHAYIQTYIEGKKKPAEKSKILIFGNLCFIDYVSNHLGSVR